jgi:hypothetical protein
VAYFCHWAEAWAGKSWADELSWRPALEAEFANLRAAVGWTIDAEDEDHALRIVAAIDRAQGPFLLLEIGDWAKRAVELPTAADHPLGPVVCGTAANSFWWRSDLQTAMRLVEHGERMACYDPTALQTNQLCAVLHVACGEQDAAWAVMDRVDLSDPLSGPVPWSRAGLHPEPRPSDVATLRSHQAKTGSTIVGITADQAEAWTALRRGERAHAANLFRRSIDHASEIGARFFVHMSVAGLGMTAGVVGKLSAADLELVRLSLREQRDCGQEIDQWLVLMTAAMAMIQHSRRELATDMYRGLRASPWASAPATQDLGAVFFADENERPIDPDVPLPILATLVDAVIDELDAIPLDPSPAGEVLGDRDTQGQRAEPLAAAPQRPRATSMILSLPAGRTACGRKGANLSVVAGREARYALPIVAFATLCYSEGEGRTMRTGAAKRVVRSERSRQRQVNVRVDPALYQALEAVARQERRSVPQAARQLMEEGLRHHMDGPAAADDTASREIAALAAGGRAFDWLENEPELYDDTSGEPL